MPLLTWALRQIHGETAINVKELLRMCREEGNVQIIGTEVSRQERMAQR